VCGGPPFVKIAMGHPRNEQIAVKLREVADLLAAQGANPFRIAAYRKAAETVARLAQDIGILFDQGGVEALEGLPGIGASLAAALREMILTGRWSQLERLRGELEPEKRFQAVAGVGPKLAKRIHDTLGIETLEGLELAAHDGRLETVPGVGARRAAIIRNALAELLARPRARRPSGAAEPSVGELLDLDQRYRKLAQADKLPKIAPKRFNPRGEAWLPILHAEKGPWHYTVLFSNTARAHELKRVRDWVVIYFAADDREEGQRTVVTETQGPLRERRVVRGREQECEAYYAAGG